MGDRPQYITVDGTDVKLTNLEKAFFKEDNIKKLDVIRYYVTVAPYMLSYLKNRPLSLHRFPDGYKGKSFFQKECPDHAPEWVQTFRVRHEEKDVNYIVANDVRTVVWLANHAALEIHPWLSSIGHLANPDFAVFDLDPMPGTRFAQARKVSLLVKALLETLDLRGFPKTSGATGIQVYVPIVPNLPYGQVRRFVEILCTVIAENHPELTTVVRQVKKRGPKVYLDYLQNVAGKTIVAPYSLRPRRGAPASTPLTWAELKDENLDPRDFNLNTIPERLGKMGDPFAEMYSMRQDIVPILDRLLKRTPVHT